MSDLVQSPASEAPVHQRRTKVYKHPDREKIEALLRRGKSAFWVMAWLEEVYQYDPEDPETRGNDTFHISEKELEQYRQDWMPEASPGLDVTLDVIEDVVGRRFPASTRGRDFELELIELSTTVAQHMLGQALEQDAKLGMGVSETTLQAHGTLLQTVQTSVGIKQQLGVPGYEAQPEHHVNENINRNLNVHLHGTPDPLTGEMGPTDPNRVAAILALMNAPEDRAEQALEATAHDLHPVRTDTPES